MAKDRDRRKAAADRRRAPKKKISVLNSENITWVDYKDVNLLRRFMSERAKIRARRVTGNSAQQQRAVARAIRVAREMALLPYSVRQVTQRSKGGRGRDRDRDLGRDLPREPVDTAATEAGAPDVATRDDGAAPTLEAAAGDEDPTAAAPPAGDEVPTGEEAPTGEGTGE